MKVFVDKYMFWFYVVAAFTSSFDIFLVFSIHGFNFRIAQIILLIPFLVWLINVIRRKKIEFPVGSIFLLIWSLFIIAFVGHTTFLLRNIGYAVWLIYMIVLVFAMSAQFKSKERVVLFTRWYIISFVFVACFGIFQFITAYFGINLFLVTEFWPNTQIPRVNGFSYEPSYYATYLLMGWIMTFYFLEKKSRLFSKKTLLIFLGIMTLAMILCSSRMGILMMVLWIARIVIRYLLKLLNYKFQLKVILISVSLIFLAAIVASIFMIAMSNQMFFMQGIMNSFHKRSFQFINTLVVFKQHPLYGVSLGGIAPAIGELYGLTITSQAIATKHEGMMIFAEVLAASGAVGFVFFAIYIVKLISSPFQLLKKMKDKEMKKMLMGSVWALIGILVILQFNQNILRLYLWIHIGYVSAIYAVAFRETHFLQKTESKAS